MAGALGIEAYRRSGNVLAHSAGTLVALAQSFFVFANPMKSIISRAILHEPMHVTAEGVGMGAAPILLDMIAAGKVLQALTGASCAIGR